MENLGMEVDMECVSSLAREQRIAFMQAFVHLARSDKDFSENEKKYIKNMAGIYGLNASDKEEVLKPKTENEIVAAVKSIKNRKVAMELIKEMCVMAHADDDLTNEETLFIGKVGQAMGLPLEKIEQISNWIIDRIIWLEEGKLIFEK